jgi:hypothetical protein
MGSTENFCLRWNDFESNISTAFRELRAEGDLFDVTLACDGGETGPWRTMQAHRIVLSASSAFFKKMLRQPMEASVLTNPQSPLIYLRGVGYDDMKSILGESR